MLGGSASIWLLLTHRNGSGTRGHLRARSFGWTGDGVTHLFLVVIFDGVFVAFLQPGKRQAHLGCPPDLGARERNLKTERPPAPRQREHRSQCDRRVHISKVAVLRPLRLTQDR